MENEPFEDVFLVKNDDFPASHVGLQKGTILSQEIFPGES